MQPSFAQLAARAEKAGRSGTRGRYAPSPTGPLHLGNLRSALVAWLQARLAGGRFIMRMEDLDLPRVRAGSAEAILADLRWLGLDWDEGPDVGGDFGPYTQSDRALYYRQAMAVLDEQKLIFPCYCSRKDIAAAASAPHQEDRAPLYPGTCRQNRDFSFLEGAPAQNGRRAAWRLRAPDQEVVFRDQVLGSQRENLAQVVGDFVLFRADGLFAYQLAVVVDDGLMGITDVVRGQDLLSSSARQIALFQALGLAVPRFWHAPLVTDAHGRRLAKRDAAHGLQAMREDGATAPGLVGRMAASLGWVPPGSQLSAQELLQELDSDKFRAGLRRG